MLKTFKAYRFIFNRAWLFYCISIFAVVLLFFFTCKVQKIDSDLQDSILSVVSILFPLIAGFLTFGRELIKDLNDKITSIKKVDNAQSGRPTPDSEKRTILRLKNLASNFKSIVISTFFISFILIVFVLIAKFNSFEFNTSNIDIANFDFKHYLINNGVSYLFKLIFFTTILILFLNLSYLVFFIIQVNKEDN